MRKFPSASKQKAIDILVNEAFEHIRQDQHDSYKKLALMNAQKRGVQSNYFLWGGELYPQYTQNSTPVKYLKVNSVPKLDPSLLPEFTEIHDRQHKADLTGIKNFFSAVLSASFNNIVLKEFIPEILLEVVRSKLGSKEFKAIDYGTYDNIQFESPDATRANIAAIYDHYGDTAMYLRQILVERLLLVR